MLLCHTTYGLICGMKRDQGGMKWDGVSRNRAIDDREVGKLLTTTITGIFLTLKGL